VADKRPETLQAKVDRLVTEADELRLRLEEAEQAMEAIRTGQAESLIVEGPDGPRIFSLEGADHSYRVLVESMNEGAATLGENATILYCNARFAEMLEAPLERVMGARMDQFLPAHSRRGFSLLVTEANGGESRGELELVGETGQTVPAQISISVIHDDRRRRFCLVAADLRAQKRNEEIVAAERLARSVIEQAAEAIVVCDEEGRIIRANRGATELCGGNLVQASFDEAFRITLEPRPGGEENAGGVAAVALRGAVLRGAPAWIDRAQGHKAFIVVSAAPLTGRAQKIIGCVITMTDISEQKRAEEALNDLNRRLATADRRKDEFLAMLGHELRNPLSPIITATQVMKMRGNRGREIQIIERQLVHLVRLVDDLLDVSRITSGKLELRQHRVALAKIVRRGLEMASPLLEQRAQSLKIEVPDEDLVVEADADRLSQVVANLLTNAAKYSNQGSTIDVTARRSGDLVRLSVVDRGIGIAPQMLEQVFDMFVQQPQALDRSVGGLGLGLTIVRSLVALHGGKVEARSEGPGRGSEFIVELPLAPPGVEVDDRRTRPRQMTTGEKRKILVVDDNEDACESLSELLTDLGYETQVAHDGPTALDAVRSFKADICLLDIGLPVMDGYELARRLRESENLPEDVRIVALTGYGQDSDRHRAADAGFDDHLVKPVSLERLESVVSARQGPPGSG
jgi:PAS domain S-box-containing protein